MVATAEFEEELSEEQIEDLLQLAESKRRTEKALAISGQTFNNTLNKSAHAKIPNLPIPYVQTRGDISKADKTRLIAADNNAQSVSVRKVEDPVIMKQKLVEAKKATAGPQWFDMPRTNLTPELKRDLQLLKLRGVLDPKRHYRKDNKKAEVPAFSQVGTLQEAPTDFFSARIPKRERKKTFVEEVLAGEHETGRFKRKYNELQQLKRSGKKGQYKAMLAKRRGNKLKR